MTGLDELTSIPSDEDGPVFTEPWHAQVFAMAVNLNEAGHLEWSTWAEALSAQITAAGPDDDADYYDHWLAALESVTSQLDLAPADERARAHDAWDMAARSTPHGQPVSISWPPTGRPTSAPE